MADEKQKGKRRLGFDDEGKPYKGVHPDTGERLTVTLEALKDEFGPKKGEEMYRKIAAVSGGGAAQMPIRLDEGARDIGLAGADKDVLEKVNAILAGKE
jgi:hypothetical protein